MLNISRRLTHHAPGAMMRALALLLAASTADAQGAKPLTKCAPDAVVSGTVCMDKYEASVWRVPNPATVNKGLVKKIQQGKATSADLAKGAPRSSVRRATTTRRAPIADRIAPTTSLR